VKTPEQEAAIRSIRKLIDFWQISLEELVVDGEMPVRPTPVPESLPKYRHPISGDTWDGQGSQPIWLRQALTREGYTVDELRIPGSVGPVSGEPPESMFYKL
jgi:DNA-binding protein H-NS